MKVFFDADYSNYVSEWYKDRSSYNNASNVSTTAGQTTTINAALADKPLLAITTGSLLNGELAVPYSAILEAAGGTEFYYWHVLADSLPGGLTLSSNGVISGTPTAQGDFNFIIEVLDSSSPQQSDTQAFSISIGLPAGTEYLISGKVETPSASPVPGVEMTGLPGNPVTNSLGEYVVSVPANWTGTVTPILEGYNFTPPSIDYPEPGVQDNYPDQNYEAVLYHTISGTVTYEGLPVSGVVMSGLPGDPVTDGGGYYSGLVESGTAVIVIPTMTGYEFTPPSIDYGTVASSHTNQDYTASLDPAYTDDSYEDNDDLESRKPIDVGTHSNLRLLDEDWYFFDITSADIAIGPDLRVMLQGVLPKNMEIELYDSSENLLTAGVSPSENEAVYISDVSPGTYIIHIPYWGSGLRNDYTLTIQTGDFDLGKIVGTITGEISGESIEALVDIRNSAGDFFMQTYSDETTGQYSISLPPDDYKVFFRTQSSGDYYAGINHLSEWYSDRASQSRAEVVSVVADVSTTADAQLTQGGKITGVITDSQGNPLEGILVRDWGADGRTISHAYSDANGFYSLERLPTGNYKLRFRRGGGLALEFYNDKSSFAEGDIVPVEKGQITSGIDVVLEEGGYLEGVVKDIHSAGIEGVIVNVYDSSMDIFYSSSRTDANGYYSVPRLPTGNVKVQFNANSTLTNHISEWYSNSYSYEEATPVSVLAGGEITTLPDVILDEGGYISGQVTDPEGNGIEQIQINVFDMNGVGRRSAYTDEYGDYTLNRVPSGEFKVRFRPRSGTYAVEWFEDATSFNSSAPVSVLENQTTSGVDAQLDEGGFISGTVTSSSGPVEGILVVVFDEAHERSLSWAPTD
ncbi:MAG: carboxypeptidase regulatory-like domain-containing protein, partial [Candidatus Thorarchaeota archaeon]